MFYYRTSFSKKAVFLEETAKTPSVRGNYHFEGKGAPGDKNQYNLFIGIDVLNIFHLTTFLKKTIFSKI